MSMTLTSHLYEVPKKIGLIYDRHGYRTHLVGDYDVK